MVQINLTPSIMGNESQFIGDIIKKNQEWATISASLEPLLIINIIILSYLFLGIDRLIIKKLSTTKIINEECYEADSRLGIFLFTYLPLLGLLMANTMNFILLQIFL